LLAEGKTDHEIAQVLAVERCTISTHVHRILSKLQVRNRVEAALWWERHRPDQ